MYNGMNFESDTGKHIEDTFAWLKKQELEKYLNYLKPTKRQSRHFFLGSCLTYRLDAKKVRRKKSYHELI